MTKQLSKFRTLITWAATYCDVLPGNASVISEFWILYLDSLGKSSGGIYD
jgi:hypothetical protein